jgi:putative nucleotidyltransferase with HDIG domain
MREIKGGKITDNLLSHSVLTLEKMEYLSRDFGIFKTHKKRVEAYYARNKARLKLAALLHDIKKPETKEVIEDTVHFYGHDSIGSDWFGEIGKKLKFSSKERDYISTIIKNHMRVHLLANQKEITERAKRRLCFELGNDIIGLALFSLADQISTIGTEDLHLLEVCNQIINYYFSMKDEVEMPLLKGKDLIKHFNLTPGPFFGEILRKVQMAYEEGEIKTKEEALVFVEETIRGLDITES